MALHSAKGLIWQPLYVMVLHPVMKLLTAPRWICALPRGLQLYCTSHLFCISLQPSLDVGFIVYIRPLLYVTTVFPGCWLFILQPSQQTSHRKTSSFEYKQHLLMMYVCEAQWKNKNRSKREAEVMGIKPHQWQALQCWKNWLNCTLCSITHRGMGIKHTLQWSVKSICQFHKINAVKKSCGKLLPM